MSFTYLERQELNALSKEVFGRTSFWYNKVYKTGVKNTETKKIRTFSTIEELKAYMLEVKGNTAKMLEEMKASAADVSIK